MNSMWKPRALLAVLALVVGIAAAPSVAASEEASEVTRSEYVERAEPICKRNVLANKRIFKGTKAEVKAGKLKQASRHFARAATAFSKTIGQLAALQAPADDSARIERWLDLLRHGRDLIRRIGKALAAGDKHRAESYAVDLNRNSSKANNTVLSFGFDYCRIEPSRFTG
jgi:hypothetical protein